MPVPAVCVFGNGLSIEYSQNFRLAALTAAFRREIDRLARPGASVHLLEFAQYLQAEPIMGNPQEDFENLIGPLDKLAEALVPLEKFVRALQIDRAPRDIIGAREAVRAIYLQSVGAVLGVIAAEVGIGEPAIGRVRTAVSWCLESLRWHQPLRIFTTNYDGLLASRILEQAGEGLPQFNLSDIFAGFGVGNVTVRDRPIEVLPYRADETEYRTGERDVILYHLHGSIAWLQDRTTGEILKARRLDDLREVDLFGLWAQSVPTPVAPLVVLSNQKESVVTRAPFAWPYRELRRSIAEARRVLVGGYSFRDVPLNRALRDGLHEAVDRDIRPGWLVVAKGNNEEARTNYSAAAELALGLGELRGRNFQVDFLYDGLTDSLDHLGSAWWQV